MTKRRNGRDADGDPASGRPGTASPRPGRKIAVAVAVVLAAGAVVWAVSANGEKPSTFPGADLPNDDAREPPPDFPTPVTEEDRLRLLVEMLLSADQDDALWARDRLLAAGPAARALVVDIATRSLESNTAFVQHALDVILTGPRPEDARLAIEGLTSRDPHVVTRCSDILGILATAAPPDAVPALAKAARQGYPIAQHACSALASIGGDAADKALAAIAADEHADPTPRQQALVALGKMEGPVSLLTMRSVFDGAKDRQIKVAAAQGLVERRDPHPIAWLREQFAASQDEQALTLLAWAGEDAAFAEIERRLTGALEEQRRRLVALSLLERYPSERKIPLLRRVARETDSDEIRADAWELLARAGAPDDELMALLTSNAPTERARRERMAAVLVIGRLRKASFGDAILGSLPPAGEPALRIMYLRAIILCDATQGAETVIREMATDQSGFDAEQSPSLNLAAQMEDASRAFRKAAAPFVLKALEGGYGVPGPRAQLDLIHMAGRCCGAEAAPLVEAFLTHPERQYKEAAARVLPAIARPETMRSVRAAWWKPQDAYTRAELRTALLRLSLVFPVTAPQRSDR